MNSDSTRTRAEAAFRKEEQAREGAKAWLEYEAQARATQEKTARLRALRLAREVAGGIPDTSEVADKESIKKPRARKAKRP
jgi:hypothetical protein